MKNNKGKTFEQWVKELESSNKEFEKMSKAEKRVQIAEDVLFRMSVNDIHAETGYLIRKQTLREFTRVGGSLKDIINEVGAPPCEVCAKGGLFISYVGRVNSFDVEDISGRASHNHRSGEMQKLQEIFSDRQLALIELAFEGWQVEKCVFISQRAGLRARKLYNLYINDGKRLTAICNNIIENKGTFKP